uniref:Zinc finger, RAN-binding domain containing 3 n=1 Tax=Electrophorus electricus TaxID=8005 RepID=A0A4W4DN85_ELEEL
MIKTKGEASEKSESCFRGEDEDLLLLPEKLQKRLMPFQRQGVRFALSRDGRLVNAMGLGKTLQALSVAYLYRQEWPLLIVVPSSLKYPWMEELEHWLPELGPQDINLVQSKADIAQSKVTVLGYGLLTTDARPLVDALNKQQFGVIIVDESHYLKSRNAARTKILVPVIQKAKRAILLTGTPALGRPEELFMQIDALYPRRFGTWSDYAKTYCNAHYKFFGSRRQWDCRGASNLDELHQRLSEIMIRRLKEEVLTQLPAKIRQRIPFDLPKEAAKEASASLEKWESLMQSLNSSGEWKSEIPFTEVMGLITQMYKQTAVAKAGAVKDYIKMLLESEQLKFLVFAHHLNMLQACTEAVIEAKAGYIRIDGSVPSAERIQLVHRFQTDPTIRVAILSIQAAGQGLTLTAASHVVFAELYWNPGHIKQAEDRAHRIGQTSSVHVHYLVAKGTFDMVMWAMLNRKEQVTGSTLNGRRAYLKAEEGEKEKWDFLNFAQAWTPSDGVVGDAENDTDGIFFSHFEKDKQHDIRTFFSPTLDKDRKRKRTGQSSTSSSPLSPSCDRPETNQSSPCHSQDSTNQDEAFCPRVKRLKQASPVLWRGGKRSPVIPRSASRRLSADLQVDRHSQKWSCVACTFSNSGLLLHCEMCETARVQRGKHTHTQSDVQSQITFFTEYSIIYSPETSDDPPVTLTPPNSNDLPPPSSSSSPVANDGGGCNAVDGSLPVYDSLKFCASKNTDRIYIYDKDGLPLNCNFIPLDIRLQNWDDLPSEFSHTENRRHLLRFVHEWSFLTTMKQRMVRRSGRVFHSPTLLLGQLTHTPTHSSTKRYLSKQEVARASLDVAQREGGTVRIISKDGFPSKRRSVGCTSAPSESSACADAVCGSGYVQALDAGGTPLCLSCQQPSLEHSGWAGGFCSPACMEEFRLRSDHGYMRARVLEAEQGVCQHCGLHAHQLYLRVRDAPHTHRKDLLDNTWLAQLPLKQLNEMIGSPVEGQFWQVDHIRPVYSGGGQCLLDNLQTLCTVCHRMVQYTQFTHRSHITHTTLESKQEHSRSEVWSSNSPQQARGLRIPQLWISLGLAKQ